MRVAFTGGRDYTNKAMVQLVMDLVSHLGPHAIVVGDCPTGLDQLVFTSRFSGGLEIHSAEWDKHGKSAGPIRNRAMLESGVDLLIAFPGGRGTADCVRQARAMNIPVITIPSWTRWKGP